MDDRPSLFDPVAVPLARKSDPAVAHRAANRAARSMGKHKRIVLDLLTEWSPSGMTPQEVAHLAYERGLVALGSMESVRRRVSDLYREGRVVKTGAGGRDAEVYALASPSAHSER